MAQTKIILDFDGVLFDSAGFKDGLYEAVRPFGVTREKWLKAVDSRDADGVFRLSRQAELLSGGRRDKAMIKAMQTEAADALWYLYADARPFLDRLSPHAELHLVTFGDPELQQLKIDATNIRSYFASVQIVTESKAHVKLPVSTVDRAIFINDSVKEMTEMAGVYRWAMHLHVNRGGSDVPSTMPFESFGSLGPLADRLLNAQVAS